MAGRCGILGRGKSDLKLVLVSRKNYGIAKSEA